MACPASGLMTCSIGAPYYRSTTGGCDMPSSGNPQSLWSSDGLVRSLRLDAFAGHADAQRRSPQSTLRHGKL